MTKVLVIILTVFISFSQLQGQNVKMEVAGSLVVGDSEDASPAPGTMRWTGVDFEAFNGLKWVSLTGGKTAPAVDVEGNVYPTLKIGDQIWFQQNLRTSEYRDGTNIPLVTDKTQWSNQSTGAYCWYDNNNIYDQPEGKLYNWYAVDNNRGLCPEGWRVPTEADFNELAVYLGGAAIAGGKMKQEGDATWSDPNIGATNSSEFTALGFGTRYSGGDFSVITFRALAQFWTIDEGSSGKARIISLSSQLASVFFTEQSFGYGIPVRCIK